MSASFCEWLAYLYRSRRIFATVSWGWAKPHCFRQVQGMSDSSSPRLPNHCNFSGANSHHILGGGTVLPCESTSEVRQYIHLPIHWEYEITHQVQWEQLCLHQKNSSKRLSPVSKVLLSAVGKQRNKQAVYPQYGHHRTGKTLDTTECLNLCTVSSTPHCSTNITMFCKISTGKVFYSKSTLLQNTRTL